MRKESLEIHEVHEKQLLYTCVCKLWQLLYLNDFEICLLLSPGIRSDLLGKIPILGRSFLVFVLRSLFQLLCLQANGSWLMAQGCHAPPPPAAAQVP